MKNKKRYILVISCVLAIEIFILILSGLLSPRKIPIDTYPIFAAMLVLILTEVLICVLAVLVYLAVKLFGKVFRKPCVLTKEKKKNVKIVFAIVSSLVIVFNVTVGTMLLCLIDPVLYIFYGNSFDNVSVKYDEEWMIGKTHDEVVERYGGNGTIYLIYDDIFEPDERDYRLYVFYNENNICTGTERLNNMPGG